MLIHAPEHETAASMLVELAANEGRRLLIEGGGTKRRFLREPVADAVISTRKLSGITLYSPDELVMSARAGTPIAQIREVLARKNQFLPAEPIEGAVYFEEGVATIGGAVASNFSGPRRIASGAMRDHVLGLRFINGNGEIMRAGGRVLKNVTGLDICKILAGSHGSLALITEVTFKVLPQPPVSASVMVSDINAPNGIAFLSACLGSPYGVSGAAYLPARGAAVVRLEAVADSIAHRAPKLLEIAKEYGTSRILDDKESRTLWTNIAQARGLGDCGNLAVWQISAAPSKVPAMLTQLGPGVKKTLLDWGGGRVLVAGAPTMDAHLAIVTAAKEAGGGWMVLRRGVDWPDDAQMLSPEPASLAKISSGLRHSFDPHGVFSVGRMAS